MQKIIFRNEIDQYAKDIDPKVITYLREESIKTFEGHENFDLFVFDYYDVKNKGSRISEIMGYLDQEDLFFICQDAAGYEAVKNLFAEGDSNERVLYQFFLRLLKDDMSYLEDLEDEITESEMAAVLGSKSDYMKKIFHYRKQLLRLKRYYEQLDSVMDELTINDNDLLTDDGVRHFTILGNRTERFSTRVSNLRDYVTQMREAYQAQIDIEQNNLMRIFTVITAVFLPLTLMVGWYGMNFKNMPELGSVYGYPVFILVSILVCIVLLIIFKHKKWF